MSIIQRIHFQKHGDFRGQLFVAETAKNIPFSVKRAYWITGTLSEVERGFHAHKQLQQVAVAVAGSCEIVLDNGHTKESVILDRPDRGLFIGPGIWHIMRNFSGDCVLLVLADALYEESDYIRRYDEFLKHVMHT